VDRRHEFNLFTEAYVMLGFDLNPPYLSVDIYQHLKIMIRDVSESSTTNGQTFGSSRTNFLDLYMV
jgi:hypothetical protein